MVLNGTRIMENQAKTREINRETRPKILKKVQTPRNIWWSKSNIASLFAFATFIGSARSTWEFLISTDYGSSLTQLSGLLLIWGFIDIGV